MVTIESVLESLGAPIATTVYSDFDKNQLQFGMAAVGKFALIDKEELRENFSSFMLLEGKINGELNNREYQKLEDRLSQLSEENKILNEEARLIFLDGKEIDDIKKAKIQQVRAEIKVLKTEIAEKRELARNAAIKELSKQGVQFGDKILCYKKELILNRYENLVKMFPALPEDPELPLWLDMPFYTSDLTGLKKLVDSGQPIAVEGGPCLFGLQEVYVVITLKNGEFYKFDYNTAHYGPDDTGELGCESLESLVRERGKEIIEVNFIDKKKGLTKQEYYELWYPFALAKMFNAKLVIPLPDMSYRKYLMSLSSYMENDVAEVAAERFCKIIYRISDLMLQKIDEISKRYPEVEFVCIHDRAADLKQKYYEGRMKYANRSKSKDVIKTLTHNELRQQSIYDYVTMPALPLYLFGINNIIQIDCMNEVDSYRKCCQIHNSELHLFAMLYPEYLSKDGEHTVFYSKIEDKDYI